jgi:hypothetical protein
LGFEPPASPEHRAALDSTLLRGLLALTLRQPIRIITEQPATQFEGFAEFFSYLSQTYPEEITELQHIWARAWRRWFNRYEHDEHHPALNYLRDQVFMKAWLGDNP